MLLWPPISRYLLQWKPPVPALVRQLSSYREPPSADMPTCQHVPASWQQALSQLSINIDGLLKNTSGAQNTTNVQKTTRLTQVQVVGTK